MKIKIVGLYKADVLLALYNNAHYEGPAMSDFPLMRIMSRMMPLATSEAANKEIEVRFKSNDFHFDFVDIGSGPKSLELDLSGFEFDSSQYNFYHGQGLAEKVIKNLELYVASNSPNNP